jgi:hypothetical protein
MLDLGLFPKVLVLSPGGFGQYGTDDLIAFEGDLFSNLFVHGLVLLCRVFGSSNHDDPEAHDKSIQRLTVSKALYAHSQNPRPRFTERGVVRVKGRFPSGSIGRF